MVAYFFFSFFSDFSVFCFVNFSFDLDFGFDGELSAEVDSGFSATTGLACTASESDAVDVGSLSFPFSLFLEERSQVKCPFFF